jgi:hypothetical protein
MASNGHDHGHTPAAWTGVIIIMIGFAVGGVFTVMAEPLAVLASTGIVVLGVVVGLVMRSMGLGKKPAAAAAIPRQARESADDQAPAEEEAAKVSA